MAELAFGAWEDRDKHLAALREFVKRSLEWGSRQA
jgi:hypothetical protein